MSYEPRGKVKLLADAMRAEPGRIWTSAEVAQVMEVQQAAVSAHLEPAIRNGAVYRKLENGRCKYALKPFAPADETPGSSQLDVPRFGDQWRAPQMVAPRPGSDIPAPSRAPGPPPAPAAAQDIDERFPGAHFGHDLRPGDGLVRHTTEPAPAPAAEEVAQEEEEEAAEPDAFVSCRTGEIVLVGIEPDEEGRVTIPADLVALIKRQIVWSPAR